jgi:putative ABC transport system permease protein
LRPTVLLRLYRVRLRARLGAELLALAGIAIGVALVFSALIANASLTGAVRELREGIVGRTDFQLASRSAAGFDQQLLRRVERVPGAAVAPVVEARANLVGPRGRRSILLVGADPRSKAVGGDLLRIPNAPAGPGRPGLLLPAPLAHALGAGAGAGLRVETGEGVTATRVARVLGRAQLGALAESPAALAPLPLAQGLTDLRGKLSRIFVDAAPGRRREVERALKRIAAGRLNLAPADQEVAIFERAAYPASQSTALFSVLSGLVGFLLALNAMLLTVPQRRRLLVDLRMAGYAPASMFQVVLFDALLLGLAGAAAGLLLGDLAAKLLFASVPGYLTSAFAIGSQQIVSWRSAALAAGGGVLAACLAVLVPLRDALRSNPGAEPAAHAQPRQRGLLVAGGLASLALALAIAAFAPAYSLAALVALIGALLLLLRVWLRLAVGGFHACCRRLRSSVAILAALELQAGSARIRTLALAATGAVAVFATVAIGGARADLQRGLDGIAEDVDRGAGVWVAFRGPANIFATTPIAVTPTRLRAIEGLQGVRSVSRNRGSFLDLAGNRAWVLAPAPSRIDAVAGNQIEEGRPGLAVRRLRQGRWATLSEGLASELGVGVGDRVDLSLPVPTRLRVAAVTNNFGWPGGAIVLGAPVFAKAWGSTAASALGVRLAPGASAAAVAAAVRSLLGGSSSLRVETSGERTRRQQASASAGLARLGQIAAMVLISSVLAMAASMAALIWQRRQIFAALKVHGFGQDQLWRALLLEGALLLGAGCFLGAAFGLIGQILLDRALETITGFPVLYAPAASAAATTLLLATGAALVVLAVPGRLAVRVHPAAGISE